MQLGGAILGKPFAALLTTVKTVNGVCQGDGVRWESRVSYQTVPGTAGEPLDFLFP